jgi:hypothetical protein
MNWDEEPWVKFYTHRTAAWYAMCWQARQLIPNLLAIADKCGVIYIEPGPKRLRLLAGQLLAPIEYVQPAVVDLLEDGFLVEVSKGYVIRNYIEAQKAAASGAQRLRTFKERHEDRLKYREIALELGLDSETKRFPAETKRSGPVTKSDAKPKKASKPQKETKRSQAETKRFSQETKRVQMETPRTDETSSAYGTGSTSQHEPPLSPNHNNNPPAGGHAPVLMNGAQAVVVVEEEKAEGRGEPRLQLVPPPRDEEAELLWEGVLGRIADEGKSYAVTWLERLWAVRAREDVLELGAEERFFAAWVEDHYRELVEHQLALHVGHAMRLEFIVAPRAEKPLPPPPKPLDDDGWWAEHNRLRAKRQLPPERKPSDLGKKLAAHVIQVRELGPAYVGREREAIAISYEHWLGVTGERYGWVKAKWPITSFWSWEVCRRGLPYFQPAGEGE